MDSPPAPSSSNQLTALTWDAAGSESRAWVSALPAGNLGCVPGSQFQLGSASAALGIWGSEPANEISLSACGIIRTHLISHCSIAGSKLSGCMNELIRDLPAGKVSSLSSSWVSLAYACACVLGSSLFPRGAFWESFDGWVVHS